MQVKSWFRVELEKVTREPWHVTMNKSDMAIRCSHGMKVFVPYPPGLDRPFLNDADERRFVGKVLPAHRPWEEVRVPYPELRLV